MLAGIDGYKKRWIVASADAAGTTRLEIADTFAGLVKCPELMVIVIDVPIGLPEFGSRRCDPLARQMIGARRNSVFPAPIRPMLGATSYEEAYERRRHVENKGCSKQPFAILPLIESVDKQMSPALQDRVWEGHPEVSFTALGKQPMLLHKSKPEGQAQRRELLRSVFPDMEHNIAQFHRPDAITDILDAYVLLWSAQRLSHGVSQTLPVKPEFDPLGLRMEMVY